MLKRNMCLLIALVLVFTTFAFAREQKKTEEKIQSAGRIDDKYVVYFEDGGKDVVYIIDGIENHCLVPAAGFNPLIATDEELERYCFPPRPEDENDLLDWERQMSYYKETPEPEITVKVDYSIEKDRFLSDSFDDEGADAAKGMTAYTTSYDICWAGYVSNLGFYTTNPYSQVEMDYSQPDVSIVSGTGICKNLYWVGLGGKNSYKFVQAGTGTTGTSYHYAWYEYSSPSVLGTLQVISGLTVNHGNAMHVYIAFDQNNNQFNYYIANNSTGQSSNGYVSLSASSYYDGSTCEWIVERAPSGYNAYHNLGYFGSATFTNCKYKYSNNSTWYNLSTCSGLYRVILTSNGTSSGNPICTPGGPSSHTFSCAWNAYN